jgi:hypothetical protein
VLLGRVSSVPYGPGDSYHLAKEDIHSTEATDGTITMFRLGRTKDPVVYAPEGKGVGSMGTFRRATALEVEDALLHVRGVLKAARVVRVGEVGDRG